MKNSSSIFFLKIKKLICLFLTAAVLLSAFLSVSVSADTVSGTTETFNSMVKNIAVEGGSFTTNFKPGNYTYSVYLKEFRENLNVSVELNNSRFEYTVKGNKLLDRYEDNVIIVNVTDPNGQYSDENYTLNIFFDTIGLTYLDVENGIFSPQFDKFHTTYYAILENNIDTIEKANVNWKTVNADATVEVSCVDELNEDGTLPEGKRTQYGIKVFETDGTSKNYKLLLYRKSSTVSAINENALLESIQINGGAVKMPAFRQEQSFYDVIVPQSVDELDIQAYPADKSNITEVIGNTEMREDQPIYITIKVTSDIYGTSSYYTLRCQYDTMLYTQKYTDLQMIAYALCALFAGLLVDCSVILIFKRRKITGRNESVVKKTEHTEKQ